MALNNGKDKLWIIEKSGDIGRAIMNIAGAAVIVGGIVFFPIRSSLRAIEKVAVNNDNAIKKNAERIEKQSENIDKKLEKKVDKEQLILCVKPIEDKIKELGISISKYQTSNEDFQKQIYSLLIEKGNSR